MLSKQLKVVNEAGIHARPAAAIVDTCARFKSRITIVKGDIRANAKSIMNIMLLAAEHSAELVVETDGPDEEEAMRAVEKLFEERFRKE